MSQAKSIKEGQGTEEVNIQMLGEMLAPKGEEPEIGINYGPQVKVG